MPMASTIEKRHPEAADQRDRIEAYLRRSGLAARTPRVLALEDLGDVTLQADLGAASPAEHAALYREAVALIATLQRRGAELESPAFVPYGIAFDVEKLTR